MRPRVQLLLGHTKIESTVRYLGIEVDDALAIAEQVDNTWAEQTCSAHLFTAETGQYATSKWWKVSSTHRKSASGYTQSGSKAKGIGLLCAAD